MIPLYDHNPTHRPPVLTIALIILNVVVYFGWQSTIGLQQSVALAGFVPAELTTHVPGAPTHILTSMFMHGGFMHLLGNMWFLWIFGDNVENATGHVRFLVFYLLTGALATLAYTWWQPLSDVPLVGASGAISGVLGGYLVKHPSVPIRTLIPLGIFTRIIDLPAFVFLFIWIGMQILSQAARDESHGGGGVAYMAHIAGFIAGVILIFIFENPKLVEEQRRAGRRAMQSPWG
jgi:membrane associated rhomboid family serine protease